MPKTAKITLRRGRTYRRVINWLVKSTRAGVNSSGKPFVFTLRKPGAESPFFTLIVGESETVKGSSIVVTDTLIGKHRLLITDEETTQFSTFKYGEWSLSRQEDEDLIYMVGGELEIVNP
jgi:hypothetical protein